jgi:hypothetical protein
MNFRISARFRGKSFDVQNEVVFVVPNPQKGRWCYSEKFTILLTIFEQSSWKWSLGAGASFYVGLQKKKNSLYGVWCAFCANSTVKNFPFFARFSWFFLEVDSWMQGQLSGCSLFKWIWPWYRKVVINVIKMNISLLHPTLATFWRDFRAKKGLNPSPAQRVWDFSLGKFGACVRRHHHWYSG